LSRSDELRVADILEAAGQIAEHVEGRRAAFDNDWTRQRAAERLANAISDDFQASHPEVPWRLRLPRFDGRVGYAAMPSP